MFLTLLLLACTPEIDGPQQWECVVEHTVPFEHEQHEVACEGSEEYARLAIVGRNCLDSNQYPVEGCSVTICERLGKACSLE